jgi:glyoxylase-like metal-dependent hydrolase (beta-lactamase superfamily II)
MVTLTARVHRLRAPNPSLMTLDGTNTYVIDAGRGLAAVVDPGPAHVGHVDAIVASATERGLDVAAILVTHGHPDHAPGAAPLQARTGAPVYAHPLALFPHDVACADRDAIAIGDIVVDAYHAPGHARDHLVFWLHDDRLLFTGDVVVGRGTVVIAPPGGDMRQYQATLERLRREFSGARSIFGGHGERVDDPRAKLDEYIEHRIEREAGIVSRLERDGALTIPQLVRSVYAGVDPAVYPAAARQVMAYLEALEREGRVRSRELERAATTEERLMLHPDLSRLTDRETARVISEELSLRPGDDRIREYALSSALSASVP